MKNSSLKHRPLKKTNKLILCNQAADLDSVACAYVLGELTGGKAVIPIPERELKLRTEIIHALEKAAVSTDRFIFAENIPDSRFLIDNKIQVILTDHNAVPPSIGIPDTCICGIIDHHAPEGETVSRPDIKVILERTGSCATLVGELLLKKSAEENRKPDRGCALLLAGAILLDTYNFAPETGTATEKDRKILDELAVKTGIDTEAWFRELKEKKTDFSGFTPEDYLIKDYKEFIHHGVKCGYSAVYRSLEPIADKNFTETAYRFSRERKLDMFIIMSVSMEKSLRKETAFLSEGQKWDYRETVSFFNSRGTALVHRKSIESESGTLELFELGNIRLSRKNIVPFTKEFIEYNQKN